MSYQDSGFFTGMVFVFVQDLETQRKILMLLQIYIYMIYYFKANLCRIELNNKIFAIC